MEQKRNYKWIGIIGLCVVAIAVGICAGYFGKRAVAEHTEAKTEVAETQAETADTLATVLPEKTQEDPTQIEVAAVDETNLMHIYEKFLYDSYKMNPEMARTVEPEEEMPAYYYAYYDIDGNGRSELVVGTPFVSDNVNDAIKSIYVFDGNQVIDLLKTSNIGQDYNKRMVDAAGHVMGYTEYGKVQRTRICDDGRIIYTMKIDNYPEGSLFVYKLASNGVSLDNVQKYSTVEKKGSTYCQILGDGSVPEQEIGSVVGTMIREFNWQPIDELEPQDTIEMAEAQEESEEEKEDTTAEAAVDGYDAVLAELHEFFNGAKKAEEISVAALREPMAAYHQMLNGEGYYNGLYCGYAPSYLLYDVSGDGKDDLLLQMYTEEMSSHLWGVLTIQDGKYVFVKAPEKYAAFNRDDDVTWPTVAANLMWQSQYTGDGAYSHVWVGYTIKDGKLAASECYGVYGDGESTVYHTAQGVPFNDDKSGIDFSQMTSEKVEGGGKSYVSGKVSDASLSWTNFINE